MKTQVATLAAVALLGSFAPLHAQDKEAQMKAGQAAAATCMACHGADGKGLPVGAMKMAPALSGSAVVNGDPELFARVILKGIKKEGAEFIGVMAPLEGSFKAADGSIDAEKLAAVMTYVRNSYDNSAAPVTTEQAKAAAEKFKASAEPVTRAELTAAQQKK
jgi:mono/diheme cytochrome c family protein